MTEQHSAPITGDSPLFGPGHPEWCPVGNPGAEEPHMHCAHWSECEPCCRCGDDTPDPNCDCPRCTYVRQADQGYPRGELRHEPDPEAPWPSGMCGKKRSCDRCPSPFLCTTKARAEMDRIRGTVSGWDAIGKPQCLDCGVAVADAEQHDRWHSDQQSARSDDG